MILPLIEYDFASAPRELCSAVDTEINLCGALEDLANYYLPVVSPVLIGSISSEYHVSMCCQMV